MANENKFVQPVSKQDIGRTERIKRYQRMMADVERDKLMAARKLIVRKYRANKQLWPDGIGPWYKPEEWTDEGEPVNTEAVNKGPVNTPVNTERQEPVNRSEYMREYMRRKRAKPEFRK